MAAAPKAHALAVPLPTQGHLNPLMRLCKLLASHDILITFVNLDAIHDRLEQIHSTSDVHDPAHMNIRRARIPFKALDLTDDYKLTFQNMLEPLDGLTAPLEELINRLSLEGPPVTCIISDMYMSSATDPVADNLHLPRVVLYPCSQSCNLLFHYVIDGSVSLETFINATNANKADLFHDALPGLPRLRNADLCRFKHVVDETDFMCRFVYRQVAISYSKADMIVVNSFEELERPAFEAMSKKVGLPVFSVGPLIEVLSDQINTSLWAEEYDCLKWLDKQPADSVLYISFGSITLLSELQFEELLFGLEGSNQRFLWSFRPDLVEGASCTELPDWFLKKTKERGCVVSWAPQVRVLGHAAVGGFLTHCGWNSTMEAIARGVPMLCWPYFADQFMDCKYVVEEWKVGVRLEGAGGVQGEVVVVGREEMERVVRALMEGEEGKLLRSRSAGLAQAAGQSLLPGGSSHAYLQSLVQFLQSSPPSLT